MPRIRMAARPVGGAGEGQAALAADAEQSAHMRLAGFAQSAARYAIFIRYDIARHRYCSILFAMNNRAHDRSL